MFAARRERRAACRVEHPFLRKNHIVLYDLPAAGSMGVVKIATSRTYDRLHARDVAEYSPPGGFGDKRQSSRRAQKRKPNLIRSPETLPS